MSGASRGVGFATAKALVERGAKVVITARGEERLRDSESKLKGSGGEVAAVAGDVGRYEDCERMVKAAMEGFGRLDILVNNAGVSMRGEFVDLSPEVCTRVAQTNLMGSIYLTKAAINHIKDARGHVVFISSIAGLFGVPTASIYCASKGALKGLAESLRIELAGKVHVGVVYLGFTEHDPEKRILAADGTPVPPDRPAHHTQAHAAGLILELIEKRKKHIIMTPAGRLGAFVNRLFPGLLEKAIIFAKLRNLPVYRRFS